MEPLRNLEIHPLLKKETKMIAKTQTLRGARLNGAPTHVAVLRDGVSSRIVLAGAFAVSFVPAAFAQGKPQIPDSDVVTRSIKAVGYEDGAGSTKVILVGTPAAPNTGGEAEVEAKKGGTDIEVKIKGIPQPTTLGAEFLTYVLWTVGPASPHSPASGIAGSAPVGLAL